MYRSSADFYANPVAIVDTTKQTYIADTGTSGPAVNDDLRAAAGFGGGSWLNTGTIILIVLAVAAAGGLVWYYMKKR